MRRICIFVGYLTFSGALGSAIAQDRVFDATGFQPNRDYRSTLSFEHLDTMTGGLVLTFTDLVVPGNAGTELRFTRSYNSKNLGWTFGIAGVVTEVFSAFETDPVPGSAIDIDAYLPRLKTADGGEQPTVWMRPVVFGDPDAFRWVVSGQYFRYDRHEHRLYYPDGRVSTFEQHGGTWKIKDLRDPFGNTLAFARTDTVTTITQGFAGAGTRDIVVTFDNVNAQLPSSVMFAGHSWTYGTRTSASGVPVRFASPPEGPGWEFEGQGEITKVTTPNGGTVSYTWDTHQFGRENDAQSMIFVNSRVIKTRSTGGRAPTGSWTYSYGVSPEISGAEQTTVEGEGIQTVYVNGPTGFGSLILDGGWGLLLRIVREQQGENWVQLERESRTYQNVQGLAGMADVFRVETIRDGRTYATEYHYRADHNSDFHKPVQIIQTGDFTLTTSLGYEYSPDSCLSDRPWFGPCILGLLNSEVTEDPAGTSVAKSSSHDVDTGFRKTETSGGVTHTFEPAAGGNVASADDGLGHKTLFEYTWGVASKITAPKTTTTREVPDDSLIAWETKRGFKTKFTYDSARRLRVVTPPVGNAVQTDPSDDGTSVTVKRGSAHTRSDLDGFGRVVATENSVGVKTRLQYDSNGRKTLESLPFTGNPEVPPADSFTVDALGRLTSRKHADDKAMVTSYAGTQTGFDVTILDENNHTTVQHWQASGSPSNARIVGVTEHGSEHGWTYAYNAAGSLTGVTAPDGLGRSWSYENGTNLLREERHPESGLTKFPEYDGAGNLVKKIDARNTSFVYEYDEEGRLFRVTATNGTQVEITKIDYEENSDLRETVSVPGTSSTFHYDDAGRLKDRSDEIGSLQGLKTSYTYEGDDLDRIDYASGRSVEYTYDTEGRVTSVRDVTDASPTKHFDYAKSIAYHPSGAVASYTSGNGVGHAFGYDAKRYWPTTLTAGSLSISYTDPDGLGNPKTITTNGSQETFTYDVLDRLANFSGPYGVGRFDYDAHGNRVSNEFGSYAYFDGTLRLKQQNEKSFTYDGNGNLAMASGASYTYTLDNMMATALGSGHQSSYGYDGDQRRVSRTVDGVTTVFSHGPAGQLLTEFRASGGGVSVIADYIYAGNRLIATVLPPGAGGTSDMTVSLSATSVDGEFAAPATIVLTATATTTTGAIDRVEFFDGETLLSVARSAPYTFTWTGVQAGVHTVTAKAVNTAGRSARDTLTIRVIVLGFVGRIDVTPDPAVAGQAATVTINGNGPCGAIQVDYGDGSGAPVLPTVSFPIVFQHTWATDDVYTITATGHGNCRRTVTRQLTVGTPNARPVVTLSVSPVAPFVPAGGTVTLTATAQDPDGTIARVDFYADATLIGTASAMPYTVQWTALTPGPITLKAVATDDRGGTGEATAAVTVSHLSGVTVSPATIQEGQSAIVTVTGLSSCGAVQIDYGDGTIITYALNGLPMSQAHTWTTAGNRSVVAQGQGNCLGTFSAPVTVTPNSPPAVTLTSPQSGATYLVPASIALTATAQDSDGEIARVEFYAGTTLLATKTAAPFSFTWVNPAAGSYSLTAQAVDNLGARTISSAASVTVAIAVSGVSASPASVLTGQATTVTVTGSSTCGAVQIDFGLGASQVPQVYAISGLPFQQSVSWSSGGVKTIAVTGQGNCSGSISGTATVTANNPPSVTLTGPANGSIFNAGGTVTLTATANDSDGSVNRVEFYAGSTLLATGTAAPYMFSWVNPANGTYSLTAQAVDNLGLRTISSAAAITVTNLVTAVSASPATVVTGQPTSVTVSGASGCGAVGIDFGPGASRGPQVYPISGLPYQLAVSWSTAGSKSIIATGNGNCGGQASAGVTVTANPPPSIALTSPANGSAYTSGTVIVLSGNASDGNGMARVDFFVDGALFGSDTTAPYSVNWPVVSGTHTVTATAYDVYGGSAASAAASVSGRDVVSVAVTPSSRTVGDNATVTVTGSTSCGAVTIDYGDGTVITYALSGLPTSQTHAWATGGWKLVTATGQGSCVGQASVSIYVNWPPAVTLTAPVNGNTYVGPATVNLAATAGDPDGSIVAVTFYANNIALYSTANAPYAFTWNNVPVGNYWIWAVATDNAGIARGSNVSFVAVQDPGPSRVTSVVVAPQTVAVGQAATIAVYGTNPCGLVQVSTGDGNAPYTPISGLPYSQAYAWGAPGTYTVTITGGGNCQGQASTTVTVVGEPPAPAQDMLTTTTLAPAVDDGSSDSNDVGRRERLEGPYVYADDPLAGDLRVRHRH